MGPDRTLPVPSGPITQCYVNHRSTPSPEPQGPVRTNISARPSHLMVRLGMKRSQLPRLSVFLTATSPVLFLYGEKFYARTPTGILRIIGNRLQNKSRAV